MAAADARSAKPAAQPAAAEMRATSPLHPQPPVLAPSPALTLPSASVSPRDRAEADSIWTAYQAQVWRHIQVSKPRGIRLSGEVGLRIALDPRGELIDARIESSSGNRMLDRLALRSVHAASPLPPPPVEIQDYDLVFSVKFSFR